MKNTYMTENESDHLEYLNSFVSIGFSFEERFEKLTRMAKRMFNVPMAGVELLAGEKYCFNSCKGFSYVKTNNELSFCRQAFLQNDLLIIADTELDKRFVGTQFFLENTRIRFYAGYPLKLPNGRKIGTLCLMDDRPRYLNAEDVELLKDLVSTIEREIAALHIATLDELTQISNRRGFFMLAQKSLDYCKRNDVAASLVFFDLNNFKQINDSFGHDEGDKVLTIFTDCMIKNRRGSDIFARLGGDEFVALLINTSEQAALATVSKLKKTLDDYNQNANKGYDITFSYGVPEFNPEKHNRIEDLLAEGDFLMYQCKKKLC